MTDLIWENLPPFWKDAHDAARRLEKAAKELRDNEIKERTAKFEALKAARVREKAEKLELKKKFEEVEKFGKTPEQIHAEVLAQVQKKPKAKYVTQEDSEGFKVKVIVDENGKTLKSETVSTPEKRPKKVKKLRSEPTEDLRSNLFILAQDEEKVMSPHDYQMTLKGSKAKGKAEKQQQQQELQPQKQQQPPKKKPQHKPAHSPEKEEESPEKPKQSPKEKKPVKLVKEAKAVVSDTQHLFKPLVYLLAFVVVISFLYLLMKN